MNTVLGILKTPEQVSKYCQPKKLYPYTSEDIDVWDIIRLADQNPINKDEIILLYSRYYINPGSRGKEYLNGWNREHCWPKSLGNMNTYKPGIGTDAHNLFCCDSSVNSHRNNKYFDYGGQTVYDNSPASGFESKINCLTDIDSWEPPDIAKGIVSRAIFYMRCCYDKQGLILGEEGDIKKNQMGKLSVLLEWNRKYPVTDWEIRRNLIIEKYQGNRNPFIDYPELADKIDWLNNISDIIIGFTPYFSEIHYENKGKDEYEGFEVTVSNKLNINNIIIYLYNGRDGKYYNKINGNNLIRGDTNKNSILYYYYCKLQNGSKDGLAIYDKIKKKIYDFISYEGVLIGNNGPCIDLTSKDIGISESKMTNKFNSLVLLGKSKLNNWVISNKCSFGLYNN